MSQTNLVNTAKEFAYSEAKKYQIPSVFQLDLTVRIGLNLASRFKADKDTVLLGILFSDCMLGKAFSEKRIQDHIQMSIEKATEIMQGYAGLEASTQENIRSCVKQHHGGDKFHSIEAEICCNADCYKFATIEGILGAIRYGPEMPVTEMVKLYADKADEKWQALTFTDCKRELEPQYKAIKTFFENYRVQIYLIPK